MPHSPPTRAVHVTAIRDRVSLREKVGLGLGKVVVEGTHGTLHVLVNPIYNMTLGLNPALISSIVFIQRLWDAMLDPIWGSFSDNFRSRWGRRRPLLAAALLPVAVLFTALWFFPRDAGSSGLFWHLLLVSLAFYAVHSIYSMPLGGLVLEATDDYHERTRLAAVTFTFGFAFQIASQWLFPLTQLAVFGDGITGLRWVAVGFGATFLIVGVAPVLLCRERLYVRVASRQPRVSLLKGLRAVRDNRPFLALLSVRFVLSFGYNLVGMLSIYMNTFFVFHGELRAAAWFYGFLGSSFHLTAIVSSLFLYPRLTRRHGKKRSLQIAIAVLLFGCACKLVVYQPDLPWLQFVVFASNGVASAGFALLATAMLGDVADLDEWMTGLRREALFASLLSWFEKAGNSLGSLLCGFLLVWIGFRSVPGAQSKETLRLMQLAYFAMPTLGSIIALWLIRRYDLSEDRAYEIKDSLARRRAAAGSTN